jgi:hypothetical protein
LVTRFALVTNPGHHGPVKHLVLSVSRQIVAAPAGDDQFSRTTFHRATNAELMHQHLKRVQNFVTSINIDFYIFICTIVNSNAAILEGAESGKRVRYRFFITF